MSAGPVTGGRSLLYIPEENPVAQFHAFTAAAGQGPINKQLAVAGYTDPSGVNPLLQLSGADIRRSAEIYVTDHNLKSNSKFKKPNSKSQKPKIKFLIPIATPFIIPDT